MQVNVTPGQLVQPRAGRDSGKYYLVIKVLDDHYVLAADGTVRRLENPKKKILNISLCIRESPERLLIS